MDTACTFDGLRQAIANDDHGKWDRVVPTKTLRLVEGKLCFEGGGPLGETGLDLTPWSRSQLCTLLGIPSNYFGNCQPELQDRQFNYWLARLVESSEQSSNGELPHESKAVKLLLRGKGETLRAALSTRYNRFDNKDIVEHLTPYLSEGWETTWYAFDQDILHLRLTRPASMREVRTGDFVVGGMHVINSEVGRSAITIRAVLYRLVCTNGLMCSVGERELLRKRHVFTVGHQFRTELSEAVETAIVQAESGLNVMQESTRFDIGNVAEEIDELEARYPLPGSYLKEIREMADVSPSSWTSLYDLTNLLTLAAQRLPPTQRVETEAVAGEFMLSRLGR